MVDQAKCIAESSSFIILDKYTKHESIGQHYQSEDQLERELIRDLVSQGYEYARDLKTPEALLANARVHIESLNDITFTDTEWDRFVVEYLDNQNDSIVDKARKIHKDFVHCFTFDDKTLKNIKILDKKFISRNKLQVINQFEQTGTHLNRYDVTVLVNGLPLVQIELKRRGIAIREAFNQVHRYSKESFNSKSSLFKFLQIFVISNGTDTRYFANTTKREKNSFDFTINWAKSDNTPIKDLKDFTATFFQKNTLLNALLKYCVLDTSDTLLVMRPYQIAATERILSKIEHFSFSKITENLYKGGFVWHTTGSGKTLTSFKAAQLATELDSVDKVLFVVDRKDLDYQTMKEYQKFSPDSVNGSNSTAELKVNLDNQGNKITITTIQKLNNLMKKEKALPIYKKRVVFIFDECHRSQFGEAQKNIKAKFKNFIQFGFTGTPIFDENALGDQTTACVFGEKLHSYVITDAIRDEKVLKFKVDYNNVDLEFKSDEQIIKNIEISASDNKEALMHPERIRKISQYILENFNKKTHRLNITGKGFNGMFAVSSVDAAKLYYEYFKELQNGNDKPLKVATIFSFAANEAQNAVGEIQDELLDISSINATSKEFLSNVISEYNEIYRTNFSIEGDGFQNYYRDVSQKVKSGDIDLLIVVGMFLTGFDAPTLNTLFVDKNLRYHGLIQAYSRTNRIYDATKTFGNIVSFRDLEQETKEALTLFGDENTKNIVIERSFSEYMYGYIDSLTGQERRGFVDIVRDLTGKFPDHTAIETEEDKKHFVKLFSEYLRAENILQYYDEFSILKKLKNLNIEDESTIKEFMIEKNLSSEALGVLNAIIIPSERKIQDYKSTYNDIHDWLRDHKQYNGNSSSNIDWSDVTFEIELIKSQEINLDFILELIFKNSNKINDKLELIEDIRRIIRSSPGSRSKESLLIDFIKSISAENIKSKPLDFDDFLAFADSERKREFNDLAITHSLKINNAIKYINKSLEKGFADDKGTDLNEILQNYRPLSKDSLESKRRVHKEIVAFVEKYVGIGGGL